jgi:hypothetical protein
MSGIETICQNCRHFHPERGAVASRFSAIFTKRFEQLGKGAIHSEDGGNAGGPIYGKCKANTLDGGRYDMGMMSDMDCRAIDNEGNILFIPLDNL